MPNLAPILLVAIAITTISLAYTTLPQSSETETFRTSWINHVNGTGYVLIIKTAPNKTVQIPTHNAQFKASPNLKVFVPCAHEATLTYNNKLVSYTAMPACTQSTNQSDPLTSIPPSYRPDENHNCEESVFIERNGLGLFVGVVTCDDKLLA